jgi:hypothetical protein
MPAAKPSKRKPFAGLPRKCECGGKMMYDYDFGRVWSWCAKCTPVVKVTWPLKPKGKADASR